MGGTSSFNLMFNPSAREFYYLEGKNEKVLQILPKPKEITFSWEHALNGKVFIDPSDCSLYIVTILINERVSWAHIPIGNEPEKSREDGVRSLTEVLYSPDEYWLYYYPLDGAHMRRLVAFPITHIRITQ